MSVLILLVALSATFHLAHTSPFQQKRSFFLPVHSDDHNKLGIPSVATRRLQATRNTTMALHGAVKDFGYYYASVYIGTPPKRFAVIVDTGSTITYVPCSSCGSKCGPNHEDAAFDPSQSSTSNYLTCEDPSCQCGTPSCGCNKSKQCTYSRSYAEGSSSTGILLQDLLALNDGGQGAPVAFGCETGETGEIFKQQADGLIGLGDSSASIINQLAKSGVIEDKFALCFGSVEGQGALLLGDPDVPETSLGPKGLRYTPILKSPQHPAYYNVGLKGIAVGKTLLIVDQREYQQGYGTVLDSGTTFMYLPTPAYKQFIAAVDKAAISSGLGRVAGPDPRFPDICYGEAPPHTEPQKLGQHFPEMTLSFVGVGDDGDADDIELFLSPLNYLFVHGKVAGQYCLGVFDGKGTGTLLGGITFRNVLVVYDREEGRVGFAETECVKLGQMMRPMCSVIESGEAREIAVREGDCSEDGDGGVPEEKEEKEEKKEVDNDAGYDDDYEEEKDYKDEDEEDGQSPTNATTTNSTLPDWVGPPTSPSDQISSVALAFVAVVIAVTLLGFAIVMLQPATREKVKRLVMRSKYQQLEEVEGGGDGGSVLNGTGGSNGWKNSGAGGSQIAMTEIKISSLSK